MTRWLVLCAAGALAALAITPLPGHADPYQWCAVYSGRDGGARNCGFHTLEQCRATVSGIGGFCEHNQFYTGPAERPVHRSRKHKEH